MTSFRFASHPTDWTTYYICSVMYTSGCESVMRYYLQRMDCLVFKQKQGQSDWLVSWSMGLYNSNRMGRYEIWGGGVSSGQLGISIPSAFWSFDGSACRCRVCWRHGLCYPLPRFAPLFSFQRFSRDVGRRPHFRSIITPDEIDLMWCPNNPLGSILSSRIGHQMCIVKRSNSTLWNATNGDWKRQRHFNVYVGKLLNENR